MVSSSHPHLSESHALFYLHGGLMVWMFIILELLALKYSEYQEKLAASFPPGVNSFFGIFSLVFMYSFFLPLCFLTPQSLPRGPYEHNNLPYL